VKEEAVKAAAKLKVKTNEIVKWKINEEIMKKNIGAAVAKYRREMKYDEIRWLALQHETAAQRSAHSESRRESWRNINM